MKRFTIASIGLSILLVIWTVGAQAQTPSFADELAAIQADWSVVTYQTPAGARRLKEAEALNARAEALAKRHPDRAEALIWHGIVLSSYAGIKGGLGALGLAKKSRAALESALKLDPTALEGSAYTSLGTLYYKVPGFPLGFGDESKARQMLERALAINPDGIDPNYFYGELLLEQDDYTNALRFLERAKHAPARPGRELADAGRQKEIDALIARIQSKRGRQS